jgi:hypothetical protein
MIVELVRKYYGFSEENLDRKKFVKEVLATYSKSKRTTHVSSCLFTLLMSWMDIYADYRVSVQLENGLNQIFSVKGSTSAADIDARISAVVALQPHRVKSVHFDIDTIETADDSSDLIESLPSRISPTRYHIDVLPSLWDKQLDLPVRSEALEEYLSSTSLFTPAPLPFYKKYFLVNKYHGYHRAFFAGLNTFLTNSSKNLDFITQVSHHVFAANLIVHVTMTTSCEYRGERSLILSKTQIDKLKCNM